MATDAGWQVLVTSSLLPTTQLALEQTAAVTIAPDVRAETIRKFITRVDVIVVRNQLPSDIFEHAPRLLGAVRHGAGVDFIPVEAATAKGILVANVPGANANAVAEYCVMQMMNLVRRPDRAERLMRETGWEKARLNTARGLELRGRIVGILGFGAIGSRLAKILHFGLQADVRVCTRRPEQLPSWANASSLDVLVSQADIIVPCLPYTTETHHYLGAALISCMKPTSFVVNASRGGVIDEPALLDAVKRKQLAGAALDVFENGSPMPDDPLMSVDNLMITPHMAGNTIDAHTRIGAQCVSEVVRILKGEKPASLVNPEAWGRYQARRKELSANFLP